MELARQLEASGEPRAGLPLVEIQPSRGGKCAVFCVHPAGGHVLCYGDLARALGSEFAVWGLQARGLEAGETPRHDIGEMAADYLEAMQTVDTELPRVLLGWSSGGLVAFEMARRLAEAGRPPELLALVDVWARPPVPRELGSGASDGERLARALAGELELPEEDLRSRAGDEQLAWVLDRARQAGAVPSGFGLAEARRYLAVFRANEEAVATFEPRPYSAKVVLFRAQQEPPEAAAAPALGWDRWLGEDLPIVRVHGTHQTLLDAPGVETVARGIIQRVRSCFGDRRERSDVSRSSRVRINAID